MKNLIFKSCLLLTILVIDILSKPLSPKILDLLDKDQLAFENFRGQYRYLSCKLLIYSKLKYMFEKEIIDQFIKETPNKREFMDVLYDEMLKKCNHRIQDNTVILKNQSSYLKNFYLVLNRKKYWSGKNFSN